MSSVDKILITLIVPLCLIIGAELFFLNTIQRPKCSSCSPSTTANSMPTPTLAITSDQSYRLTDAPDRLTRFLTNALYSFLTDLTVSNPTKSVNIKANILYEGKVEAIYQGKEAQKIHPPDPQFPKRTVVLIMNVTENSQTVSIRLVESEMPYLSIKDNKGKKVNVDGLKGKQVRINRIIELPVTKNVDIVTLAPIVYTNIIVLNNK